MPRLPRCAPPDIPQHIIQRGNDRQACFADKQDFAVYLNCLDESSRRYCVDIHAWALMTNHVHLIVSPRSDGSISLMMQAVGRDYVSWFNKRHTRTGTLWEGRFRSCLIDSEHYLLTCYRYVEMNPVRAGLVSHPVLYEWSSYRHNALGHRSRLLTAHPVYLQLGRSAAERLAAYQELFSEQLDETQLSDIRAATNRGLALGSQRFKDECTLRLGRRFVPGVRGRRHRVLTNQMGSDPI